MKAKQKEKEKELGLMVQENKRLTELISKAEEEITEITKKMNRMKKGSDVGVSFVSFKNGSQFVYFCLLLPPSSVCLVCVGCHGKGQEGQGAK